MYIVKAYVIDGEQPRTAATFKTKEEAQQRLDKAFERLSDNLWTDSLKQKFYIEETN